MDLVVRDLPATAACCAQWDRELAATDLARGNSGGRVRRSQFAFNSL
jgi:hypothetical protein